MSLRPRIALLAAGLLVPFAGNARAQGAGPGTTVDVRASYGTANGSLTEPEERAGGSPHDWVADPSEQDDLFAIENLLYRQEDGGGNPFIDEDASIYESLILVTKSLNDHHSVSLRGLVDVISAASYDAVAELATAATGYNPGRLGGRVDWDYAKDGFSANLNRDYAQELYYRSNNFGGGIAQEFAEGNTTVGLRIQRYNDHLRNILFDGTVLPDEPRTTMTQELSVDQIVSRRARVRASFSYTDQGGFLATSFNRVIVAGAPQPETAPDERHRRAGTLTYRSALFERDAGQIGYRYYEDDWGIEAHTLELRWIHPVGDGKTILEPNLRYYDQSAADFFAVEFAAPQTFMTSDPDLGSFEGRTVGLDVSFLDVPFLGEIWDLEVGLNAYDRSDGLDLYWLTFGGSFRF